MPVIWRPPIALKPEEIKAAVTYLQSQGGSVDVAAIDKSPFFQKLKAVAATVGAAVGEAWRPYVQGDPKAGEELFFHPESPVGCGKCHAIGQKGGKVGPELAHLAAIRTAQFVIEAILEPSKEIASGFDSILIETKDGRLITGIIKQEDPAFITVADSQGQLQKVAKAEIAERVPQKISLMPGNFGEILTVKDFHDLLAFLMSQK
jgi:putative heme-binding domain-containing protein